MLNYLLGYEDIDTKNRRSEVLIELTGKKIWDGNSAGVEETLLLGLYYTGKTLYVDGSNFGFNKFRIPMDLFDIILKLIAKDTTISINGSGSEAMTVAANIDEI